MTPSPASVVPIQTIPLANFYVQKAELPTASTFVRSYRNPLFFSFTADPCTSLFPEICPIPRSMYIIRIHSPCGNGEGRACCRRRLHDQGERRGEHDGERDDGLQHDCGKSGCWTVCSRWSWAESLSGRFFDIFLKFFKKGTIDWSQTQIAQLQSIMYWTSIFTAVPAGWWVPKIIQPDIQARRSMRYPNSPSHIYNLHGVAHHADAVGRHVLTVLDVPRAERTRWALFWQNKDENLNL